MAGLGLGLGLRTRRTTLGLALGGLKTPASAPVISFAVPAVSVTEGNSGTQTVSNTISIQRNGLAGDVLIALTYGGTATAGSDYQTPPASVTIPDGQNSVSFSILVNGDFNYEPDETAIILATATVAGFPAVTAVKTITITNDDQALGPTSASVASYAQTGTLVAPVTGLGTGETLSSVTPSNVFKLDGSNVRVGLASIGTANTATVTTSAGRTLAMSTSVTAPSTVPLPSLPLPTGARLIAFGHSQAGFNGGGATTYEHGLVAAAHSLDPRFNFDSFVSTGSLPGAGGSSGTAGNTDGANQGVPGDHVSAIVSRLPTVIARRPDIVWLDMATNSIASGDGGGVNDPAGGYGHPASAAWITGKMDGVISSLTAQGIWVILPTVYPRADKTGGFDDTTTANRNSEMIARHQIIRDVNTWINNQAGRAGVKVYDAYADLVSTSDSDGVNPAYFLEAAQGVHLNQTGSQLVAEKYLVPLIQQMVSAGSVFDQNANNANLLGAASWNLKGSVNPNAGTYGKIATGTATARSRYGQLNGNSDSFSFSKETVSGDTSYEKQVCSVYSAGATYWGRGFFYLVSQAVSSSTIAPSSWVQYRIFVETPLDAPCGHVTMNVGFKKSDGTTNAVTATAGVVPTVTSNDGPGRGRGGYWLETGPIQLPADGDYTSFFHNMEINFWGAAVGVGVTFAVKLSRPMLRAVPDPRIAWKVS